ncbi:MAG: hypothetical protein ACK5JT_02080 [Hyphomicrobiaceae bacterium]
MATIVTVHGTFAHSETPPSGATSPDPQDLQWWQPGSTFDHDMHALLEARHTLEQGQSAGPVEVKPFVWSGDNSELGRRKAGDALLRELQVLDAKGEDFCVVGHSHGGSVVGWALLKSAARRRPLKGLKRWITVGSPFVALKKERFLFQRLDLIRKVVFVASFMLLAIFLIDVAAQLWFASERANTLAWLQRRGLKWMVTAALMSLPIVIFYFGLKFWDARSLLHYRRGVRRRALSYFGGRWLPLTHTDDEAVQGLAFLPGARVDVFDKQFAVSAITSLSIIAVPVLYLALLSWPSAMVNLADFLNTHLYKSNYPQTEAVLRTARKARYEWLHNLRARMPADGVVVQKPMTQLERDDVRERYIAARKAITENLPGKREAEHALKFRHTFFENRDGTPCNDGKLCGNGENFRINSRLLLYLATNQVTSTIAGDDSVLADRRSLWSIAIPALLVPVFSGLLALLFMLIIRTLGTLISSASSSVLNRLTNSEVKRAAFGNDTEGETAIGSTDRPNWIERSPPRLPPAIGDEITRYSDSVASNSLSKFRQAIGELASAEPKHTADTALTTYFTWKELVHASYFDVPDFRKLVARAISECDGFAPTECFEHDALFATTAGWLGEIEGANALPAKEPEPLPPIADAGLPADDAPADDPHAARQRLT